MIAFLDLSRAMLHHRAAYLEAVSRVMSSGTVLLGDETTAFESEAAVTFGVAHAVAVSSGAAALQVTLAALGIGPNDEVIVPAFTAVPTVSAVCATGARPVFVDVEPGSGLIDIPMALDAMGRSTRAIVPVHLFGAPVATGELVDCGAGVVEDAAQAHGAARTRGSAAVAYSFYPTKNMGGIGDGGLVATDDADLASTIRRRRVHGMTEGYVHIDISQNFRLSELEAAWLRLQLPDLADGNARRATIARHYRSVAPHLRWQDDDPHHVHHLCVARFTDRESARQRLAELGVGTAIHYPLALTQQPAYREFTTRACPQAEAWAAECVSLPCSPHLTDAEVDKIGDALGHLKS